MSNRRYRQRRHKLAAHDRGAPGAYRNEVKARVADKAHALGREFTSRKAYLWLAKQAAMCDDAEVIRAHLKAITACERKGHEIWRPFGVAEGEGWDVCNRCRLQRDDGSDIWYWYEPKRVAS